MQLSKTKKWIIASCALTLVVLYLVLGAFVKMRIAWCPAPEDAGMAYLRAIQEGRIVEANRYSERLGPLLDVMESTKEVTPEQIKSLKTEEYDKWKKEFLHQSKLLKWKK